LKRSKREEPAEIRRKSHRRAEESESDQSKGKQQAPAIKVCNYAEDRRQHDRRRGEYRHNPGKLGIANMKGLNERRQSRLDEIDTHHQRDARRIDNAQRSGLFWSEFFHAEQRGDGGHSSQARSIDKGSQTNPRFAQSHMSNLKSGLIRIRLTYEIEKDFSRSLS
jgi:hypothetical protein